jgi:hypothetical protein
VRAARASSKTPDDSRSSAGGEKTACVAQAYTVRAPSWRSTRAALVIVPAVSIMSSTSTATCLGFLGLLRVVLGGSLCGLVGFW